MRPASFRNGAFAAVLSLFTLVGGAATSGCEAIVGDSLPSQILCSGDLATSCPTGQTCEMGVCIVCPACGKLSPDASGDATIIFDTGHDAGTSDTGHDAGIDSGHDVVTPLPEASRGLALGASCAATGAACDPGLFCLDTVDLRGLIFEGGGSVCSETCCADGDCGDGNICYSTTGGSFCITAATAASKCGGSCGTPCCSTGSSADCTGKSVCSVNVASQSNAYPECLTFDSNDACGGDPECTGEANAPCLSDGDCANGVCGDCDIDGDCYCLEALDCCAPTDCNGGDSTCAWNQTTDPDSVTLTYRACASADGASGTGAHCHNANMLDPSCASGVCAELVLASSTQTVCAQTCCTDADCAALSYVCRPLTLSDGTPPLLVCQPPPSTVN